MSTPSIARSGAGSQLISGGAQVWSWTFPGAPLCINLSRRLIAKLQADVEARARMHGDREMGGLLFGRKRGTQAVLDIDDYMWIPSEPAPGATYSLNRAQLELLRAERTGHGSAIVGYFRTDSGDNLELQDAEIDLVGKEFADPLNVVLLISSSTPHTGGFFFWMGEGVISPFSLMDFPLDVARLPFHDDPEAGEPRSRSVSEPPPPAAPVVEPEADLVKWPVLDVPLNKKVEAAPPATVVPMPMKPAPATVAQPQPEKLSPPIPPAREAAVPERSKFGAWVAVLWTFTLLIALCATAGIIVLVFRGSSSPVATTASSTAPKTPQASTFPLQLNVEAQGTGLNIRWDAQSAPVTQAREGRLTISEANKLPVVIPLTAQQLTIGHIYFQSSAERLEIQLETTNSAGQISRESVLALSSIQRPAVPAPLVASVQQPRNAAAVPPSAPAQIPVRKVETIPIPSKSVDATAPQASETPRLPGKAFTPPSVNRSLPGVPIIDQPAVPAPQQSVAVPVPVNSVLNTRLAPPPASSGPLAAPAAAPASAPAPSPQQIRVTSSLQAARLVRKVAPVYPPVAIAGRVQGVVRFTATIAKDGTIRNLQLMSGPPVLARAASDAVSKWAYQPTLLNGQPVEVVTEIDVNFTLQQP